MKRCSLDYLEYRTSRLEPHRILSSVLSTSFLRFRPWNSFNCPRMNNLISTVVSIFYTYLYEHLNSAGQRLGIVWLAAVVIENNPAQSIATVVSIYWSHMIIEWLSKYISFSFVLLKIECHRSERKNQKALPLAVSITSMIYFSSAEISFQQWGSHKLLHAFTNTYIGSIGDTICDHSYGDINEFLYLSCSTEFATEKRT